MIFLVLVCTIAIFVAFCLEQVSSSTGPQQVHIAATNESSSVIITWSSPEACNNDSRVYYGLNKANLDYMNRKSFAQCVNFTYGNPDGLHYIHSVTIVGLNPLTKYYYLVSSYGINSTTTFNFKTLSDDPLWVPNILIFGDLGHKGGKKEHQLFTALPAMTKEVQSGNIDLVIHIGDFAYNMDDDGGRRGDKFFRNIEDIAAYVPYMVCIGNHEWSYNASHYRTRFHMPNMNKNNGFDMWYSLNIGQIHFIFWSTEVLFFRSQDNETQFLWLENDLKIANQPNNRNQRPWIITIGHRPIYCSNTDNDCIVNGSSGVQVQEYVEQLFYNYGVDIELWAHEHSYERTWPVYNFSVPQENYNQPKAPVHIITGAAGCNENDGLCINPINGSKGNWSAFRTDGKFHPYSYGHLIAYNKSVIYWDQVNAQEKKIYDKIFIDQDAHGSFPH